VYRRYISPKKSAQGLAEISGNSLNRLEFLGCRKELRWPAALAVYGRSKANCLPAVSPPASPGGRCVFPRPPAASTRRTVWTRLPELWPTRWGSGVFPWIHRRI